MCCSIATSNSIDLPLTAVRHCTRVTFVAKANFLFLLNKQTDVRPATSGGSSCYMRRPIRLHAQPQQAQQAEERYCSNSIARSFAFQRDRWTPKFKWQASYRVPLTILTPVLSPNCVSSLGLWSRSAPPMSDSLSIPVLSVR